MTTEEPSPSARPGRLAFLRRAGAFEQRLVVLMGARLVLAFVSLGIALALDTALGDVDAPSGRGLYGTVAFAFMATVVTGVMLPRSRRPVLFASFNIVTDIAIVTLLVQFSGGADSPFAFLYVVVALYGALLFDQKGALITAGLGGLSHGAVLLLGRGGGSSSGTVLFTAWALHAAAVGGVALLGSFLAAELRRTGEALRQRTHDLTRLANLHQRTVDSLMSGLLTTDRDGWVTFFNPEAQRITGLRASDALGCDVDEVLPGLRKLMSSELKGGGPGRARMAYANVRGEQLHLGVGAYFLRDEAGGSTGHVVIFQDVTEVVAMEEELRRSERLAAVGELSASIAHEIRNPLAAISGSIQMLQREAAQRESAEASRRLMDIVVRETDRLNLLITDFLQYARPGPLQIEAVELAGLVRDMLEVFQAALPESVEVEVDIPADLAVRGDAARLRQILWNLALNGVQAMPEGGVLRIAASAAGCSVPQEARDAGRNGEEKEEWVEIRIQDQGVGIPPEILEQVFDPFFTTRSEGSGLGLSTVHRIVEEHGGSLRLESSVGSGTVVRIRLPRAGAAS